MAGGITDMSAQGWDHETDLLVLGSGAAGLCAALFARIQGLEVLLCEKTAQLGGTTASSGGIVWAPGSTHAAAAGIADSKAQVRQYLKGEFGAHEDPVLTDAFVDAAPLAIAALEREAGVKFSLTHWPDYHPDRPGAVDAGRTLEAQRFDGRRLGAQFHLVRPPLPPLMLLGGLQVDKRKVDDFLNPLRSLTTFFRVIRTLVRYAADRVRYPRGTDLGAGNALVAALLEALLARKADIWTSAGLVRLIRDEDGVCGALIDVGGQPRRVRARRGVVLATGGFPHGKALRDEFCADFPHELSFGFEANVGEGIQAARAIGAAIDHDVASPGYWQPSSQLPLADGSTRGILYGYLDRGRPGVIAVDRHGQRFVNEANSYHDVGLALIKAGYGRGNHFHFVCDSRFVWHHGLGMIRPFTLRLKRFARMGYIHMADSIRELAGKIGVDPDALATTVERHNGYARDGVDLEFGKGSTRYNRLFGHPRAAPNPNLAPISKSPFIALPILPSTLGTAIGLKATADAQVVDETGQPIRGLYACGNDMASVMRGCYPGGGITLGPAIAFAWRAALHAAGAALPAPGTMPDFFGETA